MTNTLCLAAWNNITITNWGEFRPCCLMDSDPSDAFLSKDGQKYQLNNIGDFERFVNSDFMKSLRYNMLNDKWHEKCLRCKIREDEGYPSRRNDYNGILATKKLDFTLKHLEINFGNRCNLKCRMCNPSTSHLLAKEWPKLGIHDNRHYDKKFETPYTISLPSLTSMIELHKNTIKTIRMHGGEPLVVSEHDQFLVWLVENNLSKNIKISYSTNGTILTDRLIELWEKFDRVSIAISVDAVGKLNRYIRYPTNWNVLNENMKKFDYLAKNKNIDIAITPTIQALNVTRVHEILIWMRQFENIRKLPWTKIVVNPTSLDLRIIPKILRQRAAEKLLEELQITSNDANDLAYKKIIQLSKMMNDSAELNDRFQDFIDTNMKFDKIRKSNLLEVLPELTPYIKDNNNA